MGNGKTIIINSKGTEKIISDQTIKLSEDTILLNDQTVKIANKTSGISTTDSIVLNGSKYKIVKPLSNKTSEAQIFLIDNGSDLFVLKLYYPFIKPKEEVLKKINEINHPDIIQIMEYGYTDERFFEILEYAELGSLTNRSPIKDMTELRVYISELLEAINFCHKNGIIHRDIKPANIFLKNSNTKNLVLGDFGISSIIENEKDLKRTTTFNTPIYAAPEYRVSLGGNTEITIAVDYYSLGITIWELATGDIPPNGMDDLEFLRLMYDDNPPIPSDLDNSITDLITGLSLRNHKNRWGYKEVKNWLNGKVPAIKREREKRTERNYTFESINSTKLYAANQDELGTILFENPDLGRKHLYHGLIKEWLKENGYLNMFTELADITEYRYNKDEFAGTRLAAYLLNKKLKFIGLNGKSCSTKEEIADALDKNIDDYISLLQHKNHDLYLYLVSQNAGDLAEKLHDYFELYTPSEAIYYVIYNLRFSINPNIPYYYSTNTVSPNFSSLKELSDFIYDNPSDGVKIMQMDMFKVWLHFKDSEILERFLEYKNLYRKELKKLSNILPYILDPGRGYKGLKGNECYSLQDLGKEFNDNFFEYLSIMQNRNSKIYFYLLYKGWQGEYEYFYNLFDLEMASKRESVYNENIALFKIIRGCGYTPSLILNKVTNYKPSDLINNRSQIGDNLNHELNNIDSLTIAWLTIFYHEFPLTNDENSYVYKREKFDEELNRFITFIESNFPNSIIAERFGNAKSFEQKVAKKYSKLRKHDSLYFLICSLVPAALAVLLIVYSYFTGDKYLPFNVFNISGWYFTIIIAGFILYSIFDDGMKLSFSTSIIGGGIIGLLLAIVLYYIFLLIISIPLFLVCILAISLFIYYKKLKNKYVELKQIYNNQIIIEEADAEMNFIKYIFNPNDKNESIDNSEIADLRKKLLISSITLCGIVSLVLASVLFILFYYDPRLF